MLRFLKIWAVTRNQTFMKLYHYSHCPFCIRVRMGLKFLGLSYESILVAYDDEITPVQLAGVKMLPILVDDKGTAQNESLDILKRFDLKNELSWNELENKKIDIEKHLTLIGNFVHNLAMPHWIWTKEFNEESRKYFEDKKSKKRGPFKDLIKKEDQFMKEANDYLENRLAPHLSNFYESEKLTIIDIMLAAHLWGLYVVPEFQFSPKLHHYLQTIKKQTFFNYQEDLWR